MYIVAQGSCGVYRKDATGTNRLLCEFFQVYIPSFTNQYRYCVMMKCRMNRAIRLVIWNCYSTKNVSIHVWQPSQQV
jgi:hypothetical protein